jgi:trans-2,3-dihydro-3-hydroxyanthranilate isomerase
MMRITRVDMFGTAPGRGSALDVLPLDPDHPWREQDAAEHARRTDADETVLVDGCLPAEQSFASRIFNAAGETPFATHSLAGVAACLVAGGHLAPGKVARTSPAGSQWLWTDGHAVRVPFDGPAVHDEISADPALVRPYASRAHAVGVGRRFTLVSVGDDPLTLPAADVDRMGELGVTDLTLYRWDPARRQVLARVFAPGFGIPEDAGCLPAAAALGVAALVLDPASDGAPVTVTQVTTRGTASVFTCTGSIRDGAASLEVAGQVWVQTVG